MAIPSATMLIDYERFWTSEQDTTAQTSALKSARCERIFRDKATGGRWNRPKLQRLLAHLREGDVLVVWKLDRLFERFQTFRHREARTADLPYESLFFRLLKSRRAH